jgi:hypothetical protein
MQSQGINISLAIGLAAVMSLLPEAQMLLLRRTVDIMIALQLIRDVMNKFRK